MASYLDQLQLTLDEETESMSIMDGEYEGDVTAQVEDESNVDEINEEAASIEEDLEAMDAGAEASVELTQTEAVTDAVIESPEDTTEEEKEEIAEATEDSFKITLTKLGISRDEFKSFGITSDSSRTPLERIKVTNDGVKDFLAKIKEHIMAFFRAIKNKIKKLIAKLVTMVANVQKKADAVYKKYANKLNKNSEVDIKENRERLTKLYRSMPISIGYLINGGKDLKELIDVTNTISIIDKPLSALIISLGKKDRETAYELFKGNAYVPEPHFPDGVHVGPAIKLLKALKNKSFKHSSFSNYFIGGFKLLKEDYKATPAFLITGVLSNKLKLARFVWDTNEDIKVPTLEMATYTLKQSAVDDMLSDNNINITGEDVKSFIKTVADLGNKPKAICDALYKQLEDKEKNLIKIIGDVEKREEITRAEAIKLSSVYRSALANMVFSIVIERALGMRRLLSLGVSAAEMVLKQSKDNKADEKRANKYK